MISFVATAVVNGIDFKDGERPYLRLRCGIPQRVKRDGQYVTEYINATVFTSMGAQMLHGQLQERDRVTVFADRMSIDTFDKRDGSTGVGLTLNGRVELGVVRGQQGGGGGRSQQDDVDSFPF